MRTKGYIPRSIPLSSKMDSSPFSLGLFLFKALSCPMVFSGVLRQSSNCSSQTSTSKLGHPFCEKKTSPRSLQESPKIISNSSLSIPCEGDLFLGFLNPSRFFT